ncbi:MSHA biogenesis protein MshK [Janthinobacterium sp. HLX7-2]|uniref:MSHA biogenesis protein MshK n=1 Tax=Janthinobacterium sp. HLX7-2 TaxID=1259331 RepID=UPI003F23337B
MDRTLTTVSTGRALRRWAPLLLSLAWPGAQAQVPQTQADPTRPPAALWAPANAVPAAAAQPQLQSVLISTQPGGRRVAVIDGQVVKVGSKVGDAVVMEIRDTAVLLGRGKAQRTFKLYPSSKTDNMSGGKTGRQQE